MLVRPLETFGNKSNEIIARDVVYWTANHFPPNYLGYSPRLALLMWKVATGKLMLLISKGKSPATTASHKLMRKHANGLCRWVVLQSVDCRNVTSPGISDGWCYVKHHYHTTPCMCKTPNENICRLPHPQVMEANLLINCTSTELRVVAIYLIC